MNDALRKKLTEQQKRVKDIENLLVSEIIDDAAVFQLNGYSTKCFEWTLQGIKRMSKAIIEEIEAEKQKGRKYEQS